MVLLQDAPMLADLPRFSIPDQLVVAGKWCLTVWMVHLVSNVDIYNLNISTCTKDIIYTIDLGMFGFRH